MVLDLRFKMQYFERHWRKEWLGPARQKLRAFYNQYLEEGDGNTQDVYPTPARMRGSIEEVAKGAVDLKPWVICRENWLEELDLSRFHERFPSIHILQELNNQHSIFGGD